MKLNLKKVMILITFAHRGEAQSFLKHFKFKLESEKLDFYTSEEHKLGLCLTGEGEMNLTPKLPFLFAKYEISEIINFGIAGALQEEMEKDNIYSIRTIYAADNDDIKFHSFTTNDIQAKHDCITAPTRVKDQTKANKYSYFAHTVDLELWYIGNCAKFHKIPLYAFKLISDYANSDTDCFDLKSKAQEYSDKLLEFFITKFTKETKIEPQVNVDLDILPASFTQKSQIKKLLEKINIKESKELEDYISKNNIVINNKKDVNKLIGCIQENLNPINPIITHEFDVLFNPLKQTGAKIVVDPKLEKSDFTINMTINSKQNIEKLSLALENFDYEKYLSLWNGHV